MKKLTFIIMVVILGGCTKNRALSPSATSGIITTFAGNGTAGFIGDGGPATVAEICSPFGIAIDASGNVYIADEFNYCIRKVSSSGVISTIAGNGALGYTAYGMAATATVLYKPVGVAIDGFGNVYITDYENGISKVNSSGIISAFAGNGPFGYSGDGGQATAASVESPFGIAADNSGNVYFTDEGNYVIRKINTSGIINTIAGNGISGYNGDGGPATAAELNSVQGGIAVDNSGNVYFTDQGNNVIRKINTSGIITTIAGNGKNGYTGNGGPATDAELSGPSDVAVDNSGNVFFADNNNEVIRKVNPSGIISNFAGNGYSNSLGFFFGTANGPGGYSGDGGPAINAELNEPNGIALDNSGNLYIVDTYNQRIRKVSK